MTARNHIPVNRDDAEIIPPDLGVESRSLGRAPGRASTALPGNLNHATINIGDVLTEGGDPVRNYRTDQPGLIALVGINGGVEPFHFIAFHGGIYGD